MMLSREYRQALRMPRRAFLQVGGLAAVGLSLPQFLESRQAAGASQRARGTAKSCIMLYMLGGPPQQETFDMKPDAPAGPRSLFPPASTSVPGIQICSLLPRLARNAGRLAIIRSTYHGGNALFHGAGVHYNLTGWPNHPREGEPLLDRRDAPCIGAVLQQLQGERNGLPAAVQLPAWITQDGPGKEWAGQHAGFLGRNHDPVVMAYDRDGGTPGTLPASFVLRGDIGMQGLTRRRELLRSLERQLDRDVPARVRHWNAHQAKAVEVLASPRAWNAFAIDREAPRLRDRYGDHAFGRSCLVARRLVEAGVSLVTVILGGWDTHSHHLEHTRDLLLPPLDQAFSALLEDLADRGMLVETLVAWTGEFGRTPSMNGNNPPGRDHWARVYSTALAGGGIRGGQVYGRSDHLAAEPRDNPVHVRDFVATIYHALGYGPETQVMDLSGRAHFIVNGTPIVGLF